jgi:type IV secretory pathway VirB2 component (pilin)
VVDFRSQSDIDCHKDEEMNLKRSRLLCSKVYQQILLSVFCFLPYLAFADDDPMSRAGNKFYNILFGTLGTTLCCIIMGATFILAKVGKVSWDKFLYIGFCAAGFIGTPSIIALLKTAVG